MKTRRQFLGQASCAAVSSIPILSTLLNLRLAGSVAAVTAPTAGQYRALVCIFQSGGNDSFNMLTPYSGASATAASAFAEYTASRSDLALGQAQLTEIHPTNTPGRTFGVHGGMPQLAALFESGNAAFVANVGTLIEPVLNRTQVAQATKRLPLGLYSHSDQIEQWQTSVPHSRSGVGWAGKMADLIKSVNATQTVSMNISTDGSNVWQTGVTDAEYAVDSGNDNDPTGGAVALSGYAQDYAANAFVDATSGAIDSQLALEYTNLLQQTFQKKRRGARDAYALYSTATAGALPGNVVFPNTSVGRQLQQVAKAIAGRTALGAVRQTFFVNRGGWDHHSNTLALQAAMLPEIDAALGAFWTQLGLLGVQPNVTIFSASDFGRTLTSNSQGSDHAWGGNAYVVGGSVLGRKIYGSYPSLAVNPDSGPEVNPLDTGRGRLIPTTSCDQFFAEMALWLGVPTSSLPLILPNIGNFYAGSGAPLGFLA
ncbi:MAG: DUF1501 domain-containing protein [Chthoniobacter sp.]|nr:DUF1501 domain-containing protein [Chthoniobacter sp.]